MVTTNHPINAAIYITQLEQAVQAMESLSDLQRAKNFDIAMHARGDDDGIVACFADLCGLASSIEGGDSRPDSVHAAVCGLFQPIEPFSRSRYRLPRPITVDDAIHALTRAISVLATATVIDGA